MKRLIALCLALMLTLTGCSGLSIPVVYPGEYTAYEDMTYTRPDMKTMATLLDRYCQTARESTNVKEVLNMVEGYYNSYDRFQTMYTLAYIEYNRDVTSAYWEEEYQFCMDHSDDVDADLEEFYMALAQSPIRNQLEEEYFGAGFFESYDGESFWDPGLMELLDREGELISNYYALCEQADELEYYSPEYFDAYAEPLCQALIDLVLHRRTIAEYLGYDSYPEFAYEFYHYRDYTPAQAMDYTDSIRAEMAELYRQVSQSDVWASGYEPCTESDMHRYVTSAAKNMNGLIWEAYTLMEAGKLYDIGYSETKFDISFETFLASYHQPYVFVNPTGYRMDCLSFAHEFGHFVTDYAFWEGSWAGTDVLEVFSQGMEYLSLFYSDGADEGLLRYKLADTLATYVEQSAYAAFEQALYELPEQELTVDHVFALYQQTMESFGVDFEALGWDSRDLVTVPHFYTDPLYIISYVVSIDAAFQIYQLEQEQTGAGLARFEEHVTTECQYFLDFIKEAGLVSPFAPGRASEAAEALAEILPQG